MLHNRLLLVILVDCEKIVAAGMVCRSAYEILSVNYTFFRPGVEGGAPHGGRRGLKWKFMLETCPMEQVRTD